MSSQIASLLPDKSNVKLACLVAAPIYLLLVRYFRNYRQRTLEKRFAHLLDKDGKVKPDAELNPLDAQEIVWSMNYYEFPFSYNKALEFALFKTYGIPAISNLLIQTGELVGKQAAKRAEDTAIVFVEFIGQQLNSDRCRLAIARMNWIHAKYADKIPPHTLLFTWAAVCVEASEWMRKFDWRPFTPLEEFGHFVFWREIGDRMGIPRSIVPNTPDELRSWYRQYEIDNMVYKKTNQLAGEGTVDIMLASIPSETVRPYARTAIIACLEDHLRIAMGFEKVSPTYLTVIKSIFRVRAFIVKHLMLPRYYPSPKSIVRNSQGKYNRTSYNFAPFYVPTRPEFYFKGLFTGLMPSKEKYRADGFITEEDLGPEYFRNKGLKEIREAAKDLPSSDKGPARRGCPFAFYHND